jgi:hypothetical protein
MSQVSSVEERILAIEKLRPELGKVRGILAIPWTRSVRLLGEHEVTSSLVERLVRAGLSRSESDRAVSGEITELWSLERLAFERVIRGAGYKTLWAARK